MRKKMMGMLLCAALTVSMLSGCGSGKDSPKESPAAESESDPVPTNAVEGDIYAKDAFVIWGWNDDMKKILDGPFKEDYPEEYKRIVFVDTAGSDYYQMKVDSVLHDYQNNLYPDLLGLEVDYVLKYVKGKDLLSVDKLGIRENDYKNQYSYNLDLGMDDDGEIKALFWQATPGCWLLRADFCRSYLGTTDPKKLQDKFATWDKVLETAKTVNDASKGMVKLLSGYTDVFRVFSNARKTGWYDSKDKGESQAIQIDDQMKRYMDIAKEMYEYELTFGTEQWSEDWTANMLGNGKSSNAAMAYTGCPWFMYWQLGGDGEDAPNPWIENTIMIEGPQRFYWGGTGLAATRECSDPELAGKIMKYFTCETDSMIKINKLNGDFVNNKKAIKKIEETATCDKLYPEAGQNFMKFFLPLADGIDASTVTAEDQTINSEWDDQVKDYVQGQKDEEEVIKDFKAAVHEKYNYLTIE